MQLIFTFITSFILSFQGVNLDQIRDSYTGAHTSKASADAFYKMVSGASSGSTMNGYKAASKIIKAKFQTGEGRKKIITEGIKSLESTIKADPNNTELRVIRLSVQENLPKFIKYNTSISADKAFILKNYASQTSGLKSYIRKFAAQSKSFTATDRASLK